MRRSIQSGNPRCIDQEIHFAQDAWIESYRSLRESGSLKMWSTARINSSPQLKMKILDLACGCAIKSFVLARESSNVEIDCLDTKLVLNVAEDLAKRWGIIKQVRCAAGNLLTSVLGEKSYDICLLGQITHYLTEIQNRCLFHRIHKALYLGGKLVLDVPMGGTRPDENSSFLSLMLWANSGGRAYSYEEYKAWLEDEGFKSIQKRSDRLLVANR